MKLSAKQWRLRWRKKPRMAESDARPIVVNNKQTTYGEIKENAELALEEMSSPWEVGMAMTILAVIADLEDTLETLSAAREHIEGE
jgi:hypothetical protein